MIRTRTLVLLSALLVAPTVVMAAESPIGDGVGRLTLSEARDVVLQSLLQSGQRLMRVGHADYDGGGNVVVDVQTVQGITYRKVLVDGKTHRIAAPKTRKG